MKWILMFTILLGYPNIMIDDGDLGLIIQNRAEPLGLTAIVRGKVRDQYGRGVDGADVRSSGIGASRTTRGGEYILSEIPGSWTLTVRKAGYTSRRASITVENVDSIVRKDFRITCTDNDSDRICDFEDETQDMDMDGVLDGDDNCPEIPNGPALGTCMWGSRKGFSCRSLHGCGCNDEAKFGCDMWQYETLDSIPFGVVCDDPCMEDPDSQACYYKHFR